MSLGRVSMGDEFHAAYTLTCGAPDVLDGIDFAAFFDSFAGAEEIEVTVISEKGSPAMRWSRMQQVWIFRR